MKKEKAYSSYSVACKSKIEVNFVFENIWIRTSNEVEADRIIITIEYEVDTYESMVDGPVLSRPYYLNALGILSFLINEPLNVFGAQTSKSFFPPGLSSLEDYSETRYLKLEGQDFTYELNQLLDSISKLENFNKTLVYSLLDRWRKGFYLEEENNLSLIHYDEASLIYFHIFEILSNEFDDNQKEKIQQNIKEFTKELLTNHFFLKGEKFISLDHSLSKTISGLLNQEKGVYTKIMYLLTCLKLYNEEADFFIENFISERNSVAHGKKIYHDKAIFPVTPFYPIIKNPNYPLSTFRHFAACLISKYLQIDLYDEEWDKTKETLLPSYDRCLEFIKENRFRKPNPKSDDSNLYFGGINNLIRNKPKKILTVVPFYEKMLIYKSLKSEFYSSNIDAFVLILEDTNDSKIEDLCLKALDRIVELKCNPYLKYRDMVYHLRYDGFEPCKLIEHLKTGRLK